MTVTLPIRSTRLAGAVFAVSLMAAPAAFANHDVLVEGESDFDGDNITGLAEDTDGDQVFGTITAALVGGNRNITVVTSGRFAESLTLDIGNMKLAGAPGVEVVINAVLTGGDPRGAVFNLNGASNATRQAGVGLTVDIPDDQRVTLANLTLTNWTTGIAIRNNSRVTIENCRFTNNKDFGIFVGENSRVAVFGSSISSTGYRIGSAGNSPAPLTPTPGDGVFFDSLAFGQFANCTFTGNFGNAATRTIRNGRSLVRFDNCIAFDNGN